ncbi:protein SMG7-like isoform X1 [Arachis ipaensis]|uniref:protein SMG7-like isoform X1 n=1 Tax=Arachis ipaensis TaxID=130454 RepID=UPI0007AF9FA1|nr:protein SMG7-like isoform X1 [Arachis ipaensis]XP_020971927.1 protein SMG7-like isoform X1 [Arachis ipaensis]
MLVYKGLYGEDDSVKQEFAAASSYYLQANSLWPSSGNPHHQLALLASYSEDELAAAYHYFRSLVVESRFSTARDNLIATFEKLYLQLLYQFEQLYFYRAPTKSSKTTGLHKRKQISSKTTRMLLYAI